jgi:hypothetical protein
MYTEDINSANIAYYLNGKLVKSGKGLTSFSFKAGNAGVTTNLSISIQLQRGGSFVKELSITPAGLKILYEALSYTPPFYKGRALFAPQGFVKLEAVPQFSASSNSLNNNSNLVYTWTIDGEVRQSLGGYGKNTAVIRGSVLGLSTEVEVTATDPITNVTAEGFTTLDPYDPYIVFYENSPLYGVVFERALGGSIILSNEETNIFAAPFNVSKEDLNNVKYSWRINGISAEGISGRSAIFRKPEGVTGESNISLDIESTAKPLQSGSGSFSISYQK